MTEYPPERFTPLLLPKLLSHKRKFHTTNSINKTPCEMPVTAHWYKEWFNSPYYHKLYFERGEKEAAAFIDNLLNYLHPPPGSQMLDAACGRGRHARILASKGFSVTGIDLAPDSIAYAKQYENDHLQFYQHDMRLPFHINYYHYAFNFFTSFGYFYTEREHYNAIRTISNALKPNGIFMLDYLNTHYAEDHLVHKLEKKIDDVI
jgi:2-polyprenyl-3-methyl-5-hydroxy-6-metoxy-1,4-benzoquinol methylase